MSNLRNLRQWSTTHNPRWLVIVRIALGLFLFIRGISFLHNSAFPAQLIYGNSLQNQTRWLPGLICWVNLFGGFMLIVGLKTRLVAILQVPILIGAIVFINARKGGFAPGSELWLAILVLLLLVLFIIEGGGPLSMDNYFYKNHSTPRTY